MTPDAVDVLLYDFGGVFIEIDFERVFARWAELARVPVERVRGRFTHGPAYQRHERGEIDAAEYFEALRGELGIDLDDAQFADGWNRVFGPEFPGTVALVRELAPRMPQHLFSNTNRMHYDYWSVRYAKALEPLRRQFVSHRMGLRKPEAASFRHVADALGVAPGRILFFDDTLANVEGAVAAGVQAVHVPTPGHLERALRPFR